MQIKFSHCYPKLHGQKTAQLLRIELCNRSDLSERFIEYDTVYEIEPAIGAGSGAIMGHYPLPNGQYMILLFKGDHRIPFTTVRRFTEKKYRYYNSSLGKIFYIKYAAAEKAKEQPLNTRRKAGGSKRHPAIGMAVIKALVLLLSGKQITDKEIYSKIIELDLQTNKKP